MHCCSYSLYPFTLSELLKFFVKYSSWFLFALYLVAGFALLFSRNPFQHHVFLSSANIIASGVYNTTHNVTSYFSLRDINEDLQARISELELENYMLKTICVLSGKKFTPTR